MNADLSLAAWVLCRQRAVNQGAVLRIGATFLPPEQETNQGEGSHDEDGVVHTILPIWT